MSSRANAPLRIAVLIKQIPSPDAMSLGDDGRIRRDVSTLEMNAYCRRAVAKGVELAQASGGDCIVLTLGPDSAEEVLREAIACGADRGIHAVDRAFAGSDSLATAMALAAILRREGPFDLILVGKNALDADTGQVGPMVAELLGLGFVPCARALTIGKNVLNAVVETDDGTMRCEGRLPLVVAVAERLCAPAKADADARRRVDAARIQRRTAASLGSGPWGQAASPTSVGECLSHAVDRPCRVFDSLTREAVEAFAEVLSGPHGAPAALERLVRPDLLSGEPVAVVVEPGRRAIARELLGEAAVLARASAWHVVALASDRDDWRELGRWGADLIVALRGRTEAEAFAAEIATWAREEQPRVVLAASTTFGREVASRVAAATGSGLTGDGVALEIANGRLIAWKPAFGDSVRVAISCSSAIQMATVRPGVLPLREPRLSSVQRCMRDIRHDPRVRVLAAEQQADADDLARSAVVVGIGQGVAPESLPRIEALARLLDAAIAGTRKITDAGWLARHRQVGVTGRSIAPAIYLSVGASGRPYNAIGFARAGRVLAINSDPAAPIFTNCDLGLVADWRDAVAAISAELDERRVVPMARVS